jgi:O-antigen ligase/tetratricopeptide (TPR) repeat protein
MAERHTILDPDLLPVGGAKWDWAITALMAALLEFMPAAFGAVEAWSELFVVVGAAALSLCLAARLGLDPEFRLARTWLYVPAVMFLLLIVLQLIPMPASTIRGLAPWNIAAREQLLGEEYGSSQLTTLSFYPHATAEQLRAALVAVIAFVVVACVFRTVRLIKALLGIILVIGVFEAVLALAQIITGSTGIYWRIPNGQGIVTSGTFVNYSNFAQFMNLSLGAGLALVLIRLQEQGRREMQAGHWASTARAYWEKNAWIFVGIILCAVAVFTSMSRNGAISLIVAASIIGAALYRRGTFKWRGWILSAVPAVVLAILLIFGFDFVYDRLATLHQIDSYKARWDLTSATLCVWQQSPLFGTGLGTHEVVFPMFDAAAAAAVAEHADNDYAQLLEEMGLIGAITLGLFFAGIAVTALKLAYRGRSSISHAVYGLALGLIAIAIHSASDFGQRLPANFCLTATFCGLIVAIAGLEKRNRDIRHDRVHRQRVMSRSVRRAAAAVAFVGLAVISAWTIRSAYAAYIAERWYAAALSIETRLRDPGLAATDDDYAELIAAAEGAARSDPDNVNYQYWLNFYRWESISPTVDSASGQIAQSADVVPFVQQIADDLAATRRICPTFGPPYALEGQLRLFVLNDGTGAELIRKGARLAPYDPPTCLVAGELAARSGRLDEAKPLLSRAVELHPGYFDEVANLYISELKLPALARELAGNDYRRLNELAQLMSVNDQHAKLAAELRTAAEASLRQRVLAPEVSASELASLAQIDLNRGDSTSAIDLYRRALGKDYPQVDWRINLARALAKTGQHDEALHEVRICLRLRPQHPEATRMLQELSEKAGNNQSQKSGK